MDAPRRFGRLGLWAPLTGFAALIWFLVRVIPKPSRAAYPCQRAAAPLASGFVLWLLSLSGSAMAFRKARLARFASRPMLAALCALAGVMAASVLFLSVPDLRAVSLLSPCASSTPSNPPNTPIGVARGTQPGRVVWVHDPSATLWNGTSGYWWQDANTDRSVVSNMVSRAIRWLAGERSDTQAWDVLFRYFNRRQGRGPLGYGAGEKIAIKLNLAASSGYLGDNNGQNNAPQLVHALLWQLVHRAGVRAADITVGDPSRFVGNPIWDMCHADFPDVRFIDQAGGSGRTQAQPDLNVAIHHGLPEVGFNGLRHPATAFTEATYVINFGVLRGHNLAGATLCAKNHFGSTWVNYDLQAYHKGWYPGGPADDAMNGMHGYVNAYNYGSGVFGWTFAQRPMGSYNSIVDLMGHKDLGEKTLLFMVDGLYAALHQSMTTPVRWQMTPFNGHWTASLFASQDGVAIESVGLDFLLAEPQYSNTVYGTVFNYLHEAALAYAPPSGAFYDTEGDGVRLTSLGVHERWNNATDKQYSRNLGAGAGIELIASEPPLSKFWILATHSQPSRIAWEATIGGVYRMERSCDLTDPMAWSPVAGAGAIIADDPCMTWPVGADTTSACFRIIRSD